MKPEERAKAVVAEFFAATTPETSSPDREWDMAKIIEAAIRDAENAKINQVLHLVAQREIANDIGIPVIGTHCEAIAKLKSKGT